MKTFLIDGNWNLKRNFKKLQLLDGYKQSCGGSYGFIKSLSVAISKTLPDRVIVMWDGKKAGKYRYDIYNQYKSNRKKDWESEDGVCDSQESVEEKEEKLDFLTQKKKVVNTLDYLYIRQIEVDYIEADDLIAGYILQSKKEDRDEDIVIFSRDKDFKQLISERVSIITPDSISVITNKNFMEKNGYTLENELFFKCFEGDKSDCIDGVYGITKNTLIKYFPDVADRKYTYKELSDKCMYFINEEKKKQKVYQKILDSKEILYRNAILMNLKKPFLNTEALSGLDEISNLPISCDRELGDTISSLVKDYGDLLRQDNIEISNCFSPFYRIMGKEKTFAESKNN